MFIFIHVNTCVRHFRVHAHFQLTSKSPRTHYFICPIHSIHSCFSLTIWKLPGNFVFVQEFNIIYWRVCFRTCWLVTLQMRICALMEQMWLDHKSFPFKSGNFGVLILIFLPPFKRIGIGIHFVQRYNLILSFSSLSGKLNTGKSSYLRLLGVVSHVLASREKHFNGSSLMRLSRASSTTCCCCSVKNVKCL